jgi:hypothetical protein
MLFKAVNQSCPPDRSPPLSNIFALAPMSRAYDSSEGRADGPNPNASDESVPLLIDARRAQMCTFAEISGKRSDAETPGFAECEFPGNHCGILCGPSPC